MVIIIFGYLFVGSINSGNIILCEFEGFECLFDYF